MAVINGTAGSDFLIGTNENDVITGYAGNDFLDGGYGGSDTYVFGRGDGQDTIMTQPGLPGEIDKLTLGNGILLTDISVKVEGSDVILTITGSSDSVRLANYLNMPPEQRMHIEFADGAVWDGAAIDRKLNTSYDSLSLTESGTLDGGLGDDMLFGSMGNDILYGDAGNDFMDGGYGGSDTYVFGRGDGQDTIMTQWNMQGESDKLTLGSGISLADVSVQAEGSDLIVKITGTTDSVRLANYLNMPPDQRMNIVFADGAVWDGFAIDRKLYPSSDFLSLPPDQSGTLDGGLGDDTLLGSMGNDILYGDAGNDFLDGGNGGSDIYVFGRGDGQDTIMTQPGMPGEIDKLTLGSGISLADVSVQAEGSDVILKITGTTDSVRLTNYLNMAPDQRMNIVFADGAVLDGFAIDRKLTPGNDFLSLPPEQSGTLDGGKGDDVLIGSTGNDILYGDAGNDFMDGGNGGSDTYVFGRGDGQDTIMTQWNMPGESDKLTLGSGISLADVNVQAEGSDLIVKITGTTDSVRLSNYLNMPPDQRMNIVFADGAVWDGFAIDRKLYPSNDFVSLPPNQNGTLDGGLGDDTLLGSMGNDILYGDAGNDWLDGGYGGSDTYLFGRGDGQDTILTQPNMQGELDKLALGSGISLADVSVQAEGSDLILKITGSNDSVRLANYLNMPPDQRMNIVFADGAVWDGFAIDRKLYPSNDFLNLPLDQSGTLDGGLGDDTLLGSLGNDILYGDAGNDFMDGGYHGSDTYVFGRGDGQDTIMTQWNMQGETDKLTLGSGISLADVTVRAEGADVILSINGSSDSVRLSNYLNMAPDQRMNIVFADGAVWDGFAIDRKLNPGNDFLNLPPDQGGTLDGGLGDDTLLGSTGNDILYGDAGNDFMDGGYGGSDTYVFGRGDGQDTIMTQWNMPGETDKLTLGSGISLADVSVQAEGSDLIVKITGTTDSVRLSNYLNMPPDQRMNIVFADGAVWDGFAIDRKLYPSNDFVSLPPNQNGTLDGGLGDDTLLGSMGNDILYGDAGNDWLDGGFGGSDTYVFGRGDGQDTILTQLNMQGELDKLTLGSGISLADVTVQAEGLDVILTINGSTDSVRLNNYLNMAPDQRMNIVFADGAVWDGFAIDRKLYPSNDFVSLPPNQSGTLDGGLGDDTLLGSMGNDILYGDAGNDFMDGGYGGSDTYVFGRGDGQDTILTQSGMPGEIDKLTLGSGISLADVTVQTEGSDLILTISSSDSVRLAGYLNMPPDQRMNIVFADGAVWDGQAIDRKLYPSNDFLSLPPNQSGTLDGGLGDDTLLGSMGSDVLYGDAGNDWMDGGYGGSDTYVFGRGDGQDTILTQWNMPGESDKLTLGTGISLVDVTVQAEGSDVILTLTGSTDSVRLVNYLNMPPDQRMNIVFADGAVWDGQAIDRKLYPTNDFLSLPFDQSGTLDGGLGDDTLLGSMGNDTLYGDAGNDFLDGSYGADKLIGGTGDDNFIVENVGDEVVEHFDAGTDLVQSYLDYTLGANLENLALLGYATVAVGNELNNVLTGNGQNNTLDGAAGADTMIGGAGDDQYQVDNTGDVIIENPGEGTDSVFASVTYTLDANVENLTLTGTDAINGTGNALNNIINGNDGNNIINGGAGADIMIGGAGDDTYYVDNTADSIGEEVGDGFDVVYSSVSYSLAPNLENLTLTGTTAINGNGNSLNNVLIGNSADNRLAGGAGADTMDGGIGADMMIGGTSDDQYHVDNTGDVIIENADEGTDSVHSSITYTLAANVENLTLTGTAAINGIGNNLDNILTGNAAANALAGGTGNDTYYVSTGDTVTEAAGAGTDTVMADISWTLGANLENLTLTGSANINGTGNALNNLINGNDGNNIINGGAGADIMIGGSGNDSYFVDNIADVIGEEVGGGFDTVQSSVSYSISRNIENLTLTGTVAVNGNGNSMDNVIIGNSIANRLTGAEGHDTLDGRGGADTMIGGTGNDIYIVDNSLDVITEHGLEGIDTVKSSIAYTLGNNLDALQLTGSSALSGTGNTLDNLLQGNSGGNTLNGAAGTDLLQGLAGADTLTDTAGNNLFDGGAGNDKITGGTGSDFIIGGKGSDTITTGTGADVIAFNLGDGQDVVNASTGKDNTVSLGKGIKYADLLFQKKSNDLVLVTGAGEQITFKGWYANVNNRSVANLQVVIEGTTDYNPGSGSAINDNKIEQFNFDGLVTAFDQARAANPSLTSWALSSSLLNFHLNGSDTAAIGGDLAYQYATSGNLSAFSMTPAQAVLGSGQFGTSNQSLQSAASLQDESPRLV